MVLQEEERWRQASRICRCRLELGDQSRSLNLNNQRSKAALCSTRFFVSVSCKDNLALWIDLTDIGIYTRQVTFVPLLSSIRQDASWHPWLTTKSRSISYIDRSFLNSRRLTGIVGRYWFHWWGINRSRRLKFFWKLSLIIYHIRPYRVICERIIHR